MFILIRMVPTADGTTIRCYSRFGFECNVRIRWPFSWTPTRQVNNNSNPNFSCYNACVNDNFLISYDDKILGPIEPYFGREGELDLSGCHVGPKGWSLSCVSYAEQPRGRTKLENPFDCFR